jgi:hypothetical protein
MAFKEQHLFDKKEVSLIFIANSAFDAKKVEVVLTNNDIDYTLMKVPFSTALGITERIGIGFYVISSQADFCRQLLLSKKLTNGLWLEDI